MGRQSIRQQAESNVHRRSAAPQRSQTRMGNAPETGTRPANQAAHTASSPQKRPQSRSQKSPQNPAHRSPQARSPRPWLLLVFLLWGISLAMAMMATRALLDPTLASSSGIPFGIPSETPSETSSGIPSEANSVPAETAPEALPPVALDESYFYQPTADNHLPIVALSSTAISCAMSCILVARMLQPRRSPPQLRSRSKKRTAPKSPPVQPPQLPAAKAPASQSAATKPPLALPAAVGRTTPQKSEAAQPAIVTVMPANQSVPLDWEEPSLADSLDLRQRRVLPF